MRSNCRKSCFVAVVVFAGGCAQQQAYELAEPPPVPPAKQVTLDAALIDTARQIVRDLATDDEPLLRANAAEAAQHLPEVEATDLLLDRLRDEDARVRFAAAMVAGRARVDSPEIRQALHALVGGESPNARTAALFALHRLGDKTLSQQLAEATASPDPVVRANAAVALGFTEEPSAANALAPLLGDPDGNVVLNAAEALWRLGDDRGLNPLIVATVNQYADDNVIGTLGLSTRRDPRAMQAMMGKLTDDYVEVRLAAARGLGRVGSDAGYGVAQEAIAEGNPLQRGLAALAFGDIGRADAQPLIAPLLDAKDPNVRLAAATAILQLAGRGS